MHLVVYLWLYTLAPAFLVLQCWAYTVGSILLYCIIISVWFYFAYPCQLYNRSDVRKSTYGRATHFYRKVHHVRSHFGSNAGVFRVCRQWQSFVASCCSASQWRGVSQWLTCPLGTLPTLNSLRNSSTQFHRISGTWWMMCFEGLLN